MLGLWTTKAACSAPIQATASGSAAWLLQRAGCSSTSTRCRRRNGEVALKLLHALAIRFPHCRYPVRVAATSPCRHDDSAAQCLKNVPRTTRESPASQPPACLICHVKNCRGGYVPGLHGDRTISPWIPWNPDSTASDASFPSDVLPILCQSLRTHARPSLFAAIMPALHKLISYLPLGWPASG
jgi:hypothetical protein